MARKGKNQRKRDKIRIIFFFFFYYVFFPFFFSDASCIVTKTFILRSIHLLMFLSQPLFSHLNNNKGIFYKHLFFIITRDTNQHLLQHFMGTCLVAYFPVIYIIFLISHQLSEFYFEIFNIIHPKNMRKAKYPLTNLVARLRCIR